MTDPRNKQRQAGPSSGGTARIARNAGWLTVDAAVDLIAGLASSILVARSLGPENLGHYAYALGLVNMTGLVAAFGVPLATRKYMTQYLARGDLPSALSILRTTFRFQARVAATLSLLGFTWLVLSGRQAFMYPAVASLIPGLLRGVATGALVATEDARWTVRASVTSAAVHLLGVGLTLVAGWGLVGLTSALLMSRSLDLAIRWLFVRQVLFSRNKEPIPKIAEDMLHRLVQFCWQATALLALDIFVWQRSEILFLEFLSPIEQVAFFSISFGATRAAALLPRVIESATSIAIMAESGRDPARVGSLSVEVAYLLTLISVPLAAVLASCAGPLVRLAYGVEFQPAATVLATMAVLVPVRGLFLAARSLLVATDRQGLLVRWSIVGAAFNIFLALVLIPGYGALGAAWTKVLTQVVVTALVWGTLVSSLGVRPPLAQLARVTACGLAFGLIVRGAVLLEPSLVGAAIGVTVGFPALAFGLRVTGAFDPTTRERLLALRFALPLNFRRPYVVLLKVLAGGGDPS